LVFGGGRFGEGLFELGENGGFEGWEEKHAVGGGGRVCLDELVAEGAEFG
jgi:hypothetical protein